MHWLFFDPKYFLFLAPGLLFAMWAQWRVRSAYAAASRIAPRSGFTGAEAADALLRSAGINDVTIEPYEGFMSDHYVPGQRVLRLSPDVYGGRSLAALGIAAHETGHAFQDVGHYPLLAIRNGLVPLASVGSNLSYFIILIGFLLASFKLVLLGIIAFSLIVVFQLVNLPVEYDASRRARIALVDSGLIAGDEELHVKKVLDAAALTYVAATITSLLTLLYYLYRAGLLSSRN